MRKRKSLFENVCFLLLLAGSIFSVFVLTGLYRYSRTLVPLTRYESPIGVVVVWALWTVIVAMPVITLIWTAVWLVRRDAD
jgi:hypothetical protein